MSDPGLCQISLGLYQYLCRHVVGTVDTVRTIRRWNTVRDNLYSYQMRHKLITSGSFGEGLEMKGSDVDLMYIISDVVVFEDIKDMDSNPDKAAYFQILTDDTKLGFVKLLHIKSKDNSYMHLCQKSGCDLFLSNAILKEHYSNLVKRTGYREYADKIHGPCISDKEGFLDVAFCFHSSSWISQANHWISRSHNSWPSNEVKVRVVEHGVLFVPIGVKGSPNEDIQWRISFSVGEKFLIYSFTHTQLMCYALMKIVLKDLINTDPGCEDLLCSYFIKNIMFWLSEELPLSIWRPDNLIHCFVQCLERLIYCVEYSICVHYFIPENNMFENRIEGEKRNVLLANLTTLFTFKWKCILLSPQLKHVHAGNLNVEAHLFDVHFEQIVNSRIIYAFKYSYNDVSVAYPIRLVQVYRSSLVKRCIIRMLSGLCQMKAQYVQLSCASNNRKLYRKYKTCQYYLVQGLHHDTVSGLLMVASMFYRMKQYRKTLEIVFNAFQKFSTEKIYCETKLTAIMRDVLNSTTITVNGLEYALAIFYVSDLIFMKNSKLIPSELESESTYLLHFLSPVVYGHFLSFLCHYHLHDIRQCRDSIRDIILTIDQDYFIGNHITKATAYNCLGVAFQLIGDIESARQALFHAIQLDTYLNSASQRLSMLTNWQ